MRRSCSYLPRTLLLIACVVGAALSAPAVAGDRITFDSFPAGDFLGSNVVHQEGDWRIVYFQSHNGARWYDAGGGDIGIEDAKADYYGVPMRISADGCNVILESVEGLSRVVRSDEDRSVECGDWNQNTGSGLCGDIVAKCWRADNNSVVYQAWIASDPPEDGTLPNPEVFHAGVLADVECSDFWVAVMQYPAWNLDSVLTAVTVRKAGAGCVNDTDGDGVPDDEDICPGGDDNVDTDGDGVPDFCDPCPSDPLNDSDGDGSCDSEDLCLGDDSTGDTDADGVCDDSDPCTGSPNVDTDGDGICDGDGTCDDIDACPNDAFNDADDDGVCGDIDNCPDEWNAAQTDTDEDGLGDECDADDDGDGIDDVDDNCPLDYIPGQEDFDGDGAGDFCDADDDEDGVQDDVDECAYTAIGDVVPANGCSIAQLCPCENDWKNHGAYVRCVAHTTNVFVDLELITEEEKDAIMSEAGQSDCGSKK